MLNYISHCINYKQTEELEAEFTYRCSKTNQITPEATSNEKSYSTVLALINFTRFTDTFSGKKLCMTQME